MHKQNLHRLVDEFRNEEELMAMASTLLQSSFSPAFTLSTSPASPVSRARSNPITVGAIDGSSVKVRSEPRATFVGKGKKSYVLEERLRPLGDELEKTSLWLIDFSNVFFAAEYMSLPASQYSVLDADRIERVDDSTFRCYVHKFKFFAFEVCPVLLVRVEEQPDGCIIRLLSCTLQGSPVVEAQNDKFSASMVNRVSWKNSGSSPKARKLISDTTIEVTIEVPFAFRAIPVQVIEAAGNQVLGQVVRVMLPRFLSQLGKDYQAWASGDSSRRPLGTGEL